MILIVLGLIYIDSELIFSEAISSVDIFFSVATLTYLLIGAAIFDKIESGEERNQAIALRG